MIKLIKYYKNRFKALNKLDLYIIFSFIIILASIGGNPKHIFDFNLNLSLTKNNVIEKINFIRSLFPLLIFFFNLIILFKFYKLKNINTNTLVTLLLLGQMAQILGNINGFDKLAQYEDFNKYLGRYFWIICSLSLITNFFLIKKSNFQILKFLSIFFIFFLSFQVIYFFIENIYSFFDSRQSLYHVKTGIDVSSFLGHEIPRVTGISRSALIIFIILVMNFYYHNQNKIYLNFLVCFLVVVIFLYQSKFALISYFLVICFLIFILKKKSIIKFLIITIIIPIVLVFALSYSRTISINFSSSSLNLDNKNKSEISTIRDFKGGSFLSNRDHIWKLSLKYIKNQPILGYGSLSDRVLLNNDKDLTVATFFYPVSNIFLYSLLSSGILGFLILISFYFKISKLFFVDFFIKKKITILKLSIYIITFIILLRGLVENSFYIFGIDFIIILIASFYLKKKL